MNTLRLTAFLVAVALSSSALVQSPGNRDTFELLILHNNDMHARFEQTSQLSGTCTTVDREAGKCYGGFPRVAHVVKEARKAAASGEGPPVLYLNAGDTYTGTAWFTIYKWKIAAEFLNALQPDAVSFVNNDLRSYPDSVEFLKSLNTPIIATNIVINNNKIQENIHKSLIFDINGTKVGLLGYITPEINVLHYSHREIEYINEIVALTDEVARLKTLNVNIIIVLGHSDTHMTEEIAREVEGIDLVISGHTNIFTWKYIDENADADLPVKRKPYTVTQPSGKVVPIIESYSYNKYLGNLKVKFDENGDIMDLSSDPILLDSSVDQDTDAIKTIENTKDNSLDELSDIVGTTAVVLDGDSCKTNECNFGNLITDAIAYYHALNNDIVWTDAPIAIIHAGAINASVAPRQRPSNITTGDILKVLPSDNKLVSVTMNGATLKQVLEYSVADYNISRPGDHFLQLSGIRVIYNIRRSAGSRVVDALARSSGFVPEFYAITNDRTYTVLMPESLTTGELGYSMLEDLTKTTLSYDVFTCLTQYIGRRSPVYPEIADRIVLRNSATAISSAITFILISVISCLIN